MRVRVRVRVCVCVAGRRHKGAVGAPSTLGPPRVNLVGRRIQHVWTDGHVVWKGTVLEQVRGSPSLPSPAHSHRA